MMRERFFGWLFGGIVTLMGITLAIATWFDPLWFIGGLIAVYLGCSFAMMGEVAYMTLR